MSDFNQNTARVVSPAAVDMSVDVGLRAFMLGVYTKMGLGLLLAAGLAFLTSAYPPVVRALYQVVETPRGQMVGVTTLGMIVQWAPVVLLFGSMFTSGRTTPRRSGIFYWTIVSLIGAGLGVWLLLYTGASVAMSFAITATSFGALSLVGYTTKKNLSGWGSGLVMATWGLLATAVVGVMFHVPAISIIVSLIGLVLMAGIIVVRTQDLKMAYYAMGGNEANMAIATNQGALSLFIAFTNIFKFLLMLTGGSRR